jgi:hypothetical protein
MNGLFIGNVIKDIYELPRPSARRVWRPSHQASVDSAGLEDYGFPSTHAMNAVTNSVIVLLHVYEQGKLDSILNWVIGIVLVVFYTCSLTFSRIYLGAHTPIDIVGGWVLGAVIIYFYWSYHLAIDEYLLTTNWLIPKGVFFCILALLLCPQPRPAKPTFAINALVAGCVLGEMIGNRLYHDHDVSSWLVKTDQAEGILSVWKTEDEVFMSFHSSVLVKFHLLGLAICQAISLESWTFPISLVRLIIGILVLVIVRVLVKEIVGGLLSLIRIPTSSIEQALKRKRRSTALNRVVRLFSKEIHIVGLALQKTVTYTALAFSITYAVPVLLLILGLSF